MLTNWRIFYKYSVTLLVWHENVWGCADFYTENVPFGKQQYRLASTTAPSQYRYRLTRNGYFYHKNRSFVRPPFLCTTRLIVEPALINFMRKILTHFLKVLKYEKRCFNVCNMCLFWHRDAVTGLLRVIHRWPVNSHRKGQWSGALMFDLICVWTNGWANHRYAGDTKRHRARIMTMTFEMSRDKAD